MRNYISIIFATLLTLTSCVNNDVELDQQPEGSSRIVISAKSLGITTRSADTDIESSLALVDVYVMDEARNIVYSERIDKSSSPLVGGGEFVLRKNRDEFAVGEKFFVYMIANSTAPHSEAATWEELCEMTQTDENIHLSGIEGQENPDFFLMDGFAYLSEGGNDKAPDEMTAYVINDGVKGKDVFLNGTLYRAAAKIVVNLMQGSSVEFHKVMDNSVPLYSFYQLPISTLVVRPEEGVAYSCQKQTTDEVGLNADSFQWSEGEDGTSITLIGYAYANDWAKQTANESSLLLNIPMMWNKDGSEDGSKEAASPVNWYKIPISKESRFERNKCYVINVNINAVGAGEKNTPLEINNAEYVTLDWQKVNVGIGQNEAKYLTLNMEVVKIYNTNFDLDQLTFTSSSPIKSIKLKDVFSHNVRLDSFQSVDITKESDGETATVYEEGDGVYAYYIDKFGQKIQLGSDPNFDIKITEHPELTKAEVLQRELNLYQKEGADVQYIRAEVAPGHERQLNGDIHIYSPINAVAGDADLDWNSHFNTIRYLEFEVMNEQGLVATFRVEQTPITVIRNIEGFFSYRDDYVVAGEMQFNPGAFSSSFGKIEPVYSGPIHYLNPKAPFFALAGFLPYHAHECTEDGTLTYSCTSSYNGFEELLYGFMERVYHRSYAWGGPVAGIFHRDHYVATNGTHLGSSDINVPSKYYQAFGLQYYNEDNGKYYKRHYTGNFFETFWAKYVGKVYKEDGYNSNGRPRLRGQADIVKQVPNDNFDGWDVYSMPRFMANHRMYHVRVTTTSDKYIVAIPKLMDEDGNPTNDRERGYTMESEDNARTVSPSFMVASQLGESILPKNEHHYVVPGLQGIYYYAKRQCQEYVEARYDDLNESGEYEPGEPVYHYHDWRLPTAAEIEYIIEHQDISRAMDKVLYGQYYYQASTKKDVYDETTLISREVPGWIYLPELYPDEDWKEDQSYKGWYMRCVRDAFKEPKPIIYDANYNIISGN